MKKFMGDLVADGSARHADEMAFLAIAGVLAFIGLAVYSVVWHGQAFDPSAYGTGLGLAIGGAAAGMGLKAKLAPPSDGDGG